MRADGEPGSAGTAGAAEAGGADADRPAWEDDRTVFPRDVVETWKASVLDPGRFFRGVPYDEPAARPILYYLLMTVLGGFVSLLWAGLASQSSNPLLRAIYATGGTEADATFTLIGFFLTPFLAMIGLFLWATIVHLFVLIVARERRTYTATVRIICYTAGPAVFQIVPLVGSLVASVWSLVLLVAGVKAGHRTTTGGAVTVVLLSVFVPLFAFFMFAMCVVFAVAPYAAP